MGPVGRFINNASPLSKTLMAISITTGLVISHRWFYAPYARRKRFREAEEWANIILEKEEQMQNESQENHGSY